jgi:trans-aconitate methyltransferase
MTQRWDAGAYARNGRFVATMAGEVFAWLAPVEGERILDLGCGDGALTERIQQAGARVVGVDSSPAMVEAARRRGVDAQVARGEDLPFRGEFDAVFSNAALHWIADQDAVLAGVRRALRPGGRFVAEMGGHGNIAAIRTALRALAGPYGIDAEAAGANVFFTPEEYRALLERNGFAVERIELAPRPTPLPGSVTAWLQTFRRGLLDRLTAKQAERLLQDAEDLLRPVLCDREGHWIADYVRLRFQATAIAAVP